MTGTDGLLFVAPAEAGRLDRYLADQLPDLSRSRIQALIQEGAITLDGNAVRSSLRLRGGERLAVRLPPPQPSELQAEAIPLHILFEDEDLLVISKPAGMVVHPAKGHREGTLVHALLFAVPDLQGIGGVERPGIVHRLDKGTSGVLVVAKNDIALRRLQAQFMVHSVDRRYLAVVHGVPEVSGGCVTSHLARHPHDRLRFASTASGGKRAITHWVRLAVGERVTLVACRLETGRTHQVRVHMAESGHPLVADPLYAHGRQLPIALQSFASADLDHQLLHAGFLAFEHPIHGGRLEFSEEPPQDFRAFCAAAGLAIPALGQVDFPERSRGGIKKEEG